MTARRVRALGGDHGTVLVLFAFLLTSFLAIGALLIDLGQLWHARRGTQNAADLAALAAGPSLGDPWGRDPVAACDDAWHNLQANLGGLTGNAPPCASLPATCDPTTPVVVANTPAGPFDPLVRIETPVVDDAIADGRFSVGVEDGVACERLRVTVRVHVTFALAGMFGERDAWVESSAVVRGKVGFERRLTPALMSLQRTGCGAIQTSGQASVVVEAYDADHPGAIGADSLGNTTGADACTMNENASGYVVFGTSAPGGGPSIEAKPSANEPGILAMVAVKAESTRTAWQVPSGITPAPSRTPIVSRTPVDLIYNPPARPGVAQLRTREFALAASSLATLRAQGWIVYPDDVAGANCQPNSTLTVTAAKVVVNCNKLNPNGQASVVFTATELLFGGQISIGPSNGVLLPNARRIVVVGSANAPAIDVSGRLSINDGGTNPTTTAAPCTTRTPAGGVRPTTVTVLAGPFASATSGLLSMCQTTVVLADVASPSTLTTGGNCSQSLPCPTTNTGRGYLELFGAIDWSAPDEMTARADADHPFEDLALWTETSTTSEIKGQGATLTRGVFFLPNAHFRLTGQGSGDIPLNAQFFARSLELAGQGVLRLMPSPEDTVEIPVADYYLLR